MARFLCLLALCSVLRVETVVGDDSEHQLPSLEGSSGMAWPQLNVDYKGKGEVHEVDGLPLYVSGDNNSRAVIWNYDIFGFEGGRTRELVDQLADEGFMVILPDYFRGEWMDPSDPDLVEFVIENSNWDNLRADWEERVKPFAIQRGAEVFGSVGTCWGTYVVLRLCSLPGFKAGVNFHPSHTPLVEMTGEDEVELLTGALNTKQLFCPAGEDDDNVQPGGLGEEILGDQLKIIQFPNMVHGWTIRGDLSIPEVAAAVKKAMDEGTSFFEEHLKE